MGSGRELERPGAGHARYADPEDAGAGAAAWLWHCTKDRTDQPRSFSGESRFAFSRVSTAGARWLGNERLARDGEQPPGEILPANKRRPRQTENRAARLGTPGCGDRENSGGIDGAASEIIERRARAAAQAARQARA